MGKSYDSESKVSFVPSLGLTRPCSPAWCPLGPALIAPSAIKDVQNLKIRTTVNGVTKQEASTSDMVFSIVRNSPPPSEFPTTDTAPIQAELISLLSRGSTIEAGSIILSGTPLPLNRAADKEPFLKHGDEVRVFVEGCGEFLPPSCHPSFAHSSAGRHSDQHGRGGKRTQGASKVVGSFSSNIELSLYRTPIERKRAESPWSSSSAE